MADTQYILPTTPDANLGTSTSPLQTTTLLVSNLHCPSCVSHIETFLNNLHPRPYSISQSILRHTISVRHHPSLGVQTICEALSNAGYDIDSIAQDVTSAGASAFIPNTANATGELTRGFQHFTRRRRGSGTDADKSEQHRRHLRHCELCLEQASSVATSSAIGVEKAQLEVGAQFGESKPTSDEMSIDRKEDDHSLVVIHSLTVKSQTFQATISITGMTCSSCVGKITETLQSKLWTKAVNVNLLNNSAIVQFEGKGHAEELVKGIEDAGYGADLDRIDEITTQNLTPQTSEPRVWRASYSIGGMTCSSCVGTITRALEAHTWVQIVSVNLIANDATIVFEGKHHLEDIQSTIEGVGYEAKLANVVDFIRESVEPTKRNILLHVEGMYCEHCPSRIRDALNSLDQQLIINKLPGIGDPIINITYTPNAPDLTIRHIVASISAVDRAFKPTVFHPPTLEERARAMHTRERQRILYRVLLSAVVAIPAFIIGIVLMSLVSSTNSARQFLMQPLGGVSRAQWALFIMATPVYFFSADVFHRRAAKELYVLWRKGSPTPIIRRFYRFGSMNMLMSFGTSIAYFSSIAEFIIAGTRHSTMMPKNESFYFDSVIFLTMFLLTGRLIEAYSKAKTGDAVAMLAKLRPTEAILLDRSDGVNGVQLVSRTIDVDMLEIGDVVRIPRGTSPPCDGIIIEGEASNFDESSLTGESKPVSKTTGDEVYCGTVNKNAPVSVRVTKVSGASMLDQIIQIVREGQSRRAPIERVADLLTSYFVPFVTLLAIVTWLTWLILGLSGSLPREWLDVESGGWPFWSLQFAIAVFIIACPCGIGLAAPTALFVGGGLAANHGILVKGGGEAFQESSNIDIIVFDKTGTLSQGGECAITDHEFLAMGDKPEADEMLYLSALKTLEENSNHPIAKAVVSLCTSAGAYTVNSGSVQEIAGKGMKGTFNSEALSGNSLEVLAGNEALITDHGVVIPAHVTETLNRWKNQGKSIVITATRTGDMSHPISMVNWQLSHILAAADPLRPESAAVVKALHERGVVVWMLSGDNAKTAQAVGDMVGIPRDNIIAGVLPEQKADKIKYLQKSQTKSYGRSIFGRKYERTQARAIVAMVGDGVNDSPALTVADVGIAIGSGSDVAISSAEFVLVSSNLTSLLTLLDLSHKVFNRIKFNFAWALIYNLIALPVAAGVFYPITSKGKHVRLDPVWASLAMALSSISVICSSLLLRSRLPYVGFKASTTLSSFH
jgi:Cu+-exporting ATPase